MNDQPGRCASCGAIPIEGTRCELCNPWRRAAAWLLVLSFPAIPLVAIIKAIVDWVHCRG
jgi:recombinational DNA repair protein RecR